MACDQRVFTPICRRHDSKLSSKVFERLTRNYSRTTAVLTCRDQTQFEERSCNRLIRFELPLLELNLPRLRPWDRGRFSRTTHDRGSV